MNTVVKLLFVAILLSGSTACKHASNTVANAKAAKFMVYGNCEQCKATIEKALAINGIAKANWDIDSKILTAEYDSLQLKEADLHRAIASSGYDTEKERATDKAYAALPECCQYKRQ